MINYCGNVSDILAEYPIEISLVKHIGHVLGQFCTDGYRNHNHNPARYAVRRLDKPTGLCINDDGDLVYASWNVAVDPATRLDVTICDEARQVPTPKIENNHLTRCASADRR